MASRYYYGIFTHADRPAPRFVLTTDRETAIATAARYPSATIRRAPIATFRGGRQYRIDGPSFALQSDRIDSRGRQSTGE